MEESFWKARWSEGKIGFHEGKPNRWLERRIDVVEGVTGAPRSVLVPMAGKALDVAWLASRGHRVVACELVEQAVVEFFAERGLAPERSNRGRFDRFEASGVTFLRGDVFDLTEADTGPIDVVYDRAALIALRPEDRVRYVALLAGLLRPGGTFLLVGFQHGLPDGPPFDLAPSQVEALFAPHGTIEALGSDDVTDESPQFTARGATRCLESAYRVTRA